MDRARREGRSPEPRSRYRRRLERREVIRVAAGVVDVDPEAEAGAATAAQREPVFHVVFEPWRSQKTRRMTGCDAAPAGLSISIAVNPLL